ncbi:MAG: kynureninase [Armatimonadetes bacterium]|nr:kynureninase [Armatimonadota bacterium]
MADWLRMAPEELDALDPLLAARADFMVDESVVYMDGNSLGRLPKSTVRRTAAEVEEMWGRRLVRGWNEGWYELPVEVGDQIGELIGATPGETLCCDSTTVNLYKIVSALGALAKGGPIVAEGRAFPSDLYALQSCASACGRQIQYIEPGPHGWTETGAVVDAIQDGAAIVVLSHVDFRTGRLLPMNELTAAAHCAGCLIIWDLSHSVGAVPSRVSEWGVDAAVGCTYKYLNGGPGSPAFLYVNARHLEKVQCPLFGWLGSRDPFAFEPTYEPASGVRKFLVGTPPIISMTAVEEGVRLVARYGLSSIREKSERLGDLFIHLARRELVPRGMSLRSPEQSADRGSHVSLAHPDAYRICRALIEEESVIPDFRTPDMIRYGLSPLYTSYCEVQRAVEATARVIDSRVFEKFERDFAAVT